jgi:hypothetical protein
MTLPSTQRVESFLQTRKQQREFEQANSSRLIFALDATMSRQSTWDRAAGLQAEMFNAAASAGGLDIQLVFYRGAAPGECKASRWLRESAQLAKAMTGLVCRSGYTQIGRVLSHALTEDQKAAIRALVFVGDAFEEWNGGEIGEVGEKAAALGRRHIPAFMFQEGDDEKVAAAFREIARLSGGICARFDAGSAKQLADLLRAVGKFAATKGGDNLAALSQARSALRQSSALLLE